MQRSRHRCRPRRSPGGVCARALALSCSRRRVVLSSGTARTAIWLMCLRVVHPLDQVKAADFFGGLNQYLTSRTTGGGVGATGLSRARRAPV